MRVGQGVEVNTGSSSPGRDVMWINGRLSGASEVRTRGEEEERLNKERGGGASEQGASSANGFQNRYAAS